MHLNDNTTGALVVEKSGNTKVGEINITYASQVTCPGSCPLRDAGCYAESGRMAFITRQLNKSTASPVDVARNEAKEIRALAKTSLRPLRLHGVGDCSTNETASIVSEACQDYKGKVFSYTHAWRDVNRESWRDVSILGSCESLEDAIDAMDAGYAAAMVVSEHDGPRPYIASDRHGRAVLIQPCPQQTTLGVTCATCRLCMDDKQLLARRRVIAFSAHGARAKRVRALLNLEPNHQPATTTTTASPE